MKFVSVWMLLAFMPAYVAAQGSTDEPKLVVEDIRCRGNVSTSCDFIRDRLYLSSGNRVDEEEIGNAKIRLSSLPNFTAVDIHLEKGSERGRANVIIEVAEADPWTKESVVVTAARNNIVYERLAARISNENVFGTGKILSLEGGGEIPLSGFEGNAYYARLQYADPRLFSTRNYFLIAGAVYQNVSLTYDGGTTIKNEYLTADLTLGRRMFDFSYVTLGYRQFPISSRNERVKQQDGSFETSSNSYRNQFFFSYGWNTEDDPFFPTRGSRFQATHARDFNRRLRSTDAGYRQTWKFGDSIWTAKLGDTPGIVYRGSLERTYDVAIAYSRPLTVNGLGEGRRSRWYVEPGGESPSAKVWEYGIKLGVQLETRSFGHVNLYVFASETYVESDKK